MGLIWALLTVASVLGEVVIQEIMLNNGEDPQWFELYNTGSIAVNVPDWHVEDRFGTVFFADAAPLVIPPGGFVIVSNVEKNVPNQDNIDVDYSDVTWVLYDSSNGGDKIVVKNTSNNAVLDTVSWINDSTFPDPIGTFRSISLKRPDLDNTLGANWCLATTLLPGTINPGKTGTPGKVNDCVVDPTKAPMVPTKKPTKPPTKAPTKAPSKAPSKAPTKAPSKTPTRAPTKAPTKTPTMAPRVPTRVPTKNPTKVPTKSPTKHPTNAPTKAPTYQPVVPFDPSDIVINEIMARPSIFPIPFDIRRQWFELYNKGPVTVFLPRWSVSNDLGTFFQGQRPLVIAPNSFVVLGKSSDQSVNGGIVVDYVDPNWSLFTGGDLITLKGANGVLIDRVNWKNQISFASRQLPRESVSMALQSASKDNADGANWCPGSSVYGTLGLKGTPGRPNDCPGFLTPTPPPTKRPTKRPTKAPTKPPTHAPSRSPSQLPSLAPSLVPSRSPSQLPSTTPSLHPSSVPSSSPTQLPSTKPSLRPSWTPSVSPSQQPSTAPSLLPSQVKSQALSGAPSQKPTQFSSCTCESNTCLRVNPGMKQYACLRRGFRDGNQPLCQYRNNCQASFPKQYCVYKTECGRPK
jgi:Lamin Tail Domain